MRKLYLVTILVIFALSSQAQVKFGFKVSPNFSFNRVQSSGDIYNIENNGSKIKMQLGPTFDVPFRENHYFGTGLYFNTKYVGVSAVNLNSEQRTTEEFAIQYLQLPLTLKLFTDEVGLDKRLYFQFGTAVDFRLQGISETNELLNQVDFFDFSVVLAFGMEYRLGVNTKIYTGLIYNRGLLNTVNDSPLTQDQNWTLNNDLLGLELGLTF